MTTTTLTKKKTAVKKTTAKKVALKRAPRKRTSTAACTCAQVCNPEYSFWINNGPVVCSVAELRDALRVMSDDQYSYHTVRNGNDFAAWIRDCMGDAALAERVARAGTRTDAVRVLSVCCK
jgi:hypothetical protein